MGCLACLDVPGYDYALLLAGTQLHAFLASLLAAGGAGAGAGLLLSAVGAVGLLCADEACAHMLADAGLVREKGGAAGRWISSHHAVCVWRRVLWAGTGSRRLPCSHLESNECRTPARLLDLRSPHPSQVESLHALMMARMDGGDSAWVLATTTAAARCLAWAPTRGMLLGAHPEAAARFAELAQHPLPEASLLCRIWSGECWGGASVG